MTSRINQKLVTLTVSIYVVVREDLKQNYPTGTIYVSGIQVAHMLFFTIINLSSKFHPEPFSSSSVIVPQKLQLFVLPALVL